MKSHLLLVICLGYLLSGCSSEDAPTPAEELINVNSVRSVDFSPGSRELNLKLSDGSIWPFRLYVPKHQEGAILPLIIGLHWAGDERTYQEYMSCLVEPAFNDFNAIIVAPLAGNELWWEPPMREKIVEMVRLVKAYWPVDAQKIVLTGYSNGGTGCWYFADNHASDFSAIIPMAGFYESKLEKFEVPMYIIHSDKDELFPYSLAKLKIDYAVSLGSDITIKLVPDLSHFEACNYQEYLRETQLWLVQEVW